MKKKFLVTLFCICMVLGGCGSDSNGASTIKVDESVADATSVDIASKDPESVNVPEQSITDSELEIDNNETATSPIPSETSSITANITPIPVVPYDDSDDPEAMEIEPVDEGEEDLCGIIAMVVDYTDDWKCTIYCINPETGSQRKISHFELYTGMRYFPESNTATIVVTDDCDWYYKQPFDSLVSFADDYTKLAVTKVVSYKKNEVHAGWIDQKGNFFDVTEAVGNVVHDEFERAVRDRAIGFVNGGKDFVFSHADGMTGDQYIVPCNNVSSEAVSLFTENTEIAEWPLTASESSINDGIYEPCLQIDGNRITDIIDENYYLYDCGVAHVNREIIYSSVNRKTNTGKSYELVPSEARSNWGAVASPDGTQVAFISASRTESDQSIFVGDLNNNALENVHRIDSNLPESKTMDGDICYESDCLDIFCTLLDWR